MLFFDKTGSTQETWFYRFDMPEGYKHFSKTKPILPRHLDVVDEWWSNRVELVDDEGFDKAHCYTHSEIEARGYNIDLCGYPHAEEVILPPDELIRNYRAERARLDAEIDEKLAQICAILGIEVEDEG